MGMNRGVNREGFQIFKKGRGQRLYKLGEKGDKHRLTLIRKRGA